MVTLPAIRPLYLGAAAMLVLFIPGVPLMPLLASDRPAPVPGWAALPSLPDAEGFAGMFAGSAGNTFVAAGGANFPELRPWQGGVKHWSDLVYGLDDPAGPWRVVGRLPRPIGYGVSAETPRGLVCAGGGDASRHFTDVFRLSVRNQALEREALSPLPAPCSFSSGAVVGSTLYIAGGIETPGATACMKTLWALDLSVPDAKWRVLKPCPGPERMLAVAGSDGEAFYLFSGTRLSPDAQGRPVRNYLRDAWRYRPGAGWQRLADLPRSAVAAPSPAPRQSNGPLLVISGDDGKHVGYKPEDKHPGFPRDILSYDPKRDAWSVAGPSPFSRATTPTGHWRGTVVVPSGEARPGYRTPEVWTLTEAKP